MPLERTAKKPTALVQVLLESLASGPALVQCDLKLVLQLLWFSLSFCKLKGCHVLQPCVVSVEGVICRLRQRHWLYSKGSPSSGPCLYNGSLG